MIVRASVTADMDDVAALVRASFPDRLHPFMTYAQSGIATFLSAIAEQPLLFPGHRLLTCTDPAGIMAGFAEFRIDGETALLSYICVTPAARRTGAATRMIAHFLSQNPNLTRLDLDVFEDNEPAVRFYEKMGFVSAARSLWLTRRLPVPADGVAQAINPAGALAAFARYGFCEMPVQHNGCQHRLGRIGSRTLRCFAADDFDDEVLLAAVRHLLPDLDTALLILPADHMRHGVGESINASRRMSLELEERTWTGAAE
jgi:RimJ/RimL family protein N-acetyltransferase